MTSRTAKIGLGGGAALGVGGATYDLLTDRDTVTVEDPTTGERYQLSQTDTLRATEDYPEGAKIWHVELAKTQTRETDEGEPETVITGYDSKGYTIITRVNGRNVYFLDSDGSERRSQVPATEWSQAMSQRGGS